MGEAYARSARATMLAAVSSTDTDSDWRLRADLDRDAAASGVLRRFRGPDVVHDAQAAVGADVVLTHNDSALFAYSPDLDALRTARAALEEALRRDGVTATVAISRWEDDLGDWVQVEPPLDADASAAHEQAVRDAHAPVTETFVVEVGKEIRSEFENSMLAWAERLGLSCEIVEHPHLLHVQVAFTVSGAKRAVDEFRAGLGAEERATIRTERAVMISPL
jgi:hypothetical protein